MRRRLPVIVLLALAASSCMNPERADDDFGTGGASSVTGNSGDDDDSDGERADAGDENDDENDEDRPEIDDAAVAASTPVARPARDAGDAGSVFDAAKPISRESGTTTAPEAAVPTSTPDAGASEPTAAAPTRLSFSVQTVTLRGRYSPKNIYAIWVVDAQGKFVKTLAKFAFIRATWLTGWNAAAKGNVVDAVTGATQSSHAVRKVTWDLTDVSKKPVPDGEYKIVMEMTDADRTGASNSVSFTKGAAAVRLMPPDHPNFVGMSLVLE